jgi:hypothetical protein
MALLLTAFLAPEARSQITVHPADPTAILIDTLELTMELPGDVDGEGEWGTTVWLMSDGAYELVIDLESFVFPGASAGIDTLSLAVIMGSATLRSVERFANVGYLDSTGVEKEVNVWVHGWGERNGGGAATAFTSCNNDLWARRKYSVVYSMGTWQFSLKSRIIDDYNGIGSCEPSAGPNPGIQ